MPGLDRRPSGLDRAGSVIAQYGSLRLEIEREVEMPPHGRASDLLVALGLHQRSQEAFWVIAYDPVMNVRTVVEVARGALARQHVHMPSLYSAVLVAGVDRFMVAHNHPAGPVSPTVDDSEITATIARGASLLGLYFEDHWIVGPRRQHFSFVAHGLLVPPEYSGEAIIEGSAPPPRSA